LPEEGALPPEVALSVVAEAEAALPAQEAEVQVCFAELAIPLEHPCTLYALLHH